MNRTRQDAWSKDEDLILAETVLRYIREGKTQLEAFKEVAEKLSRTSAACGFRWNASIRHQYQRAIQMAREERKQGSTSESWMEKMNGDQYHEDSLERAILLLKKIKVRTDDKDEVTNKEQERIIDQLKDENLSLKKQLSRYHEAWIEMGKLWEWVEKKRVNT